MYKNWKKIGAMFSILILLTVSLSACIGGDEEDTTPSTTPVNVTNPDTIVKYTIGDAKSMDPADAYDSASGDVLCNVYETLVTYHGADLETIVPSLATDWAVSDDGYVWTFNLRENVKFSNGNDFNADDVVYSFDRVIKMGSPESGVAWILSQFLEEGGTVKIDDFTVEMHLTIPYAGFLPCLAYTVASIVDKEYVEEHGGVIADTSNEWMNENPMGTGPYMLDNWTRRTEIKLVKNPLYWGGWEGKHVSSVIIKSVDEASTRILALKNGDADFSYIPTANIVDVQGASGVRFTTFESPNVVMMQFQLNSENTFMADPKVRQAFSYAFDYDTVIENVYNGWLFRLPGSIPSGFPCYDTQTIVYTYDTNKAESILDEAGYIKNDKGYRFDGKTVRIYYNAGNEERAKMAMMFQNNLADIGVISQVIAEGWPQFLARIFRTSDWDITFCGWAPDYIDPDNYLFPFIASADIGGDVWNSSWKNETVDELLLKAKEELNPEERCELYRQAWMININDPNIIFVGQSKGSHFEREWVHGYEYNPIIPWYYYNYYKE